MISFILLLLCLPFEIANSRAILPAGNDLYAVTVKQERTTTWEYRHWKESWQRTETIERGDWTITAQHFQRQRNAVEPIKVLEVKLVLCYAECEPFTENPWTIATDWLVMGKAEKRARWSVER